MVTTFCCTCSSLQLFQQQDGIIKKKKTCFHMTFHARRLFDTLLSMILHAVGRRQIVTYTKFIETPTFRYKRGWVSVTPLEKQRLLRSNAKAIALFAHSFATNLMNQTISELLFPFPHIVGKTIGRNWVFASVSLQKCNHVPLLSNAFN